ncbi:MAG: hypothetical protein CBC48_05965 [bacterium TMED88]|nr:hypothetical protein [Deltaproteobacteria bacterium]OUV34449.1 MAG: hypothetical protein CBC48_05965 [bacterium TMED88]
MSRRHDSAFTLVELMVTTAILGVILVYVFGTMVTTQKKAVALTDTVDTQQAARQIADLIERDIRHTAMMIDDAAAICGIDQTDAPDSLYVTDWEVVTLGEDLDASLSATVTGATDLPSSASYFVVDRLMLEVDSPSGSFDTNGDGTMDSDFSTAGQVIFADANNPERGTACGSITGVLPPNQLRFDLEAGGLSALGTGSQTPRIIAVPAIRYQIDSGQTLSRGAYPLAENIEDIQFAWFIDDNEDNAVDSGEYRGDGAGSLYTAQNLDASRLREIRLNVVLRTEDDEPGTSTGNPIATENRSITSAQDGFRRRVYTSVVRLRNLGRRVDL